MAELVITATGAAIGGLVGGPSGALVGAQIGNFAAPVITDIAFGGNTLLAHVLTGWLAIIPWLLPTLLNMALMPLVHKRFKQTNVSERTAA